MNANEMKSNIKEFYNSAVSVGNRGSEDFDITKTHLFDENGNSVPVLDEKNGFIYHTQSLEYDHYKMSNIFNKLYE